MARSVSVNYSNPQYGKATADADLFQPEDVQELGQAVDVHDHSANNGLPVKRVQFGTLAGRPAAGNAGHVYVATDTKQLFIDDGATWTAISADALVTTGDIQDGAVTTPKLAANVLSADATGRSKMQDGFVTEGKIGAGAVTNTKIGDGAVTTGKIGDNQVTRAKIADFGATYRPMRHRYAGDYFEQWGEVNVNSDSSVEVTFAVAFKAGTTPNIMLTCIDWMEYDAYITARSNTAFTIAKTVNGRSGTVMWRAVGEA